MIKTCLRCNTNKDIIDFYAHKDMKDGRLNYCKDCTKKRVSKHRTVNLDEVRTYDRERGKLQHRKEAVSKRQKQSYKDNPEKQRERQKQYREKYPEKYKANYLVNNAIRDGRLIKKPCELCKNPNVEAHHDNYSKPLEVRWLCTKHHGETREVY